MSLFDALKGIVVLPVNVVRDIVTFGGTCSDDDYGIPTLHTVERLKQIYEDLNDITGEDE